MARSKKKVTKSRGWGGARAGAGRPIGSGTGRSANARINRVVAMLSNAELAQLKRGAKTANLPLGTHAYKIIERSLRRSA